MGAADSYETGGEIELSAVVSCRARQEQEQLEKQQAPRPTGRKLRRRLR